MFVSTKSFGSKSSKDGAGGSLVDGILEARSRIFADTQNAAKRDKAQSLFHRLRRKAFFGRLFGGDRGSRIVPVGAAGPTGRADDGLSADHVFVFPIASLAPDAVPSPYFDYAFRPLRREQRKAWLRAYIDFDRDNIENVLVRKATSFEKENAWLTASGREWIVVHGHYTVSVARALGLEDLPASLVADRRAACAESCLVEDVAESATGSALVAEKAVAGKSVERTECPSESELCV